MDENVLNYAISHGIIDLDIIRERMLKEEREKYLNKHKYKIFQDKDGRWKTTLPNKKCKNGRKLIAKKNKDDLENSIVEYYMELEKNPHQIDADITLEELYPIWLESRLLEVNSVCTAKKNDQDWKRYYKGTEITKIPMRLLTANSLRDWAHEMINEYHLNKKAYYNMTVIIKKCFEYVESENICENTWQNVKINTKKFIKQDRKDNSTQIYFDDEKAKLVKYCIQQFLDNPRNISALSIPFLFITGIRIGELVALKYSDISEYDIEIQRSEVNDYDYEKENKCLVYAGKVVVDHTKTNAGTRKIPYTKGAKKIIDMISRASKQYGFYDEGYIFCPNSKRIVSNTVDTKIYRYCKILGIPAKSAHKIRKTYISQIIRDGIDLDTVCKVSGHVDLKTTFDSYCYSLDKKEETYAKFEEIFNNELYLSCCSGS